MVFVRLLAFSLDHLRPVSVASSRKIAVFDDVGAGHHFFQLSPFEFPTKMTQTTFIPIHSNEFGGAIVSNSPY